MEDFRPAAGRQVPDDTLGWGRIDAFATGFLQLGLYRCALSQLAALGGLARRVARVRRGLEHAEDIGFHDQQGYPPECRDH